MGNMTTEHKDWRKFCDLLEGPEGRLRIMGSIYCPSCGKEQTHVAHDFPNLECRNCGHKWRHIFKNGKKD